MKSKYLASILLLLLLVSFPLAYYAYAVGELSLFPYYEEVSSLLFWFSIVSLAFLFPLRYIAVLFGKYIKTLRGALVFVSYMSVHLILYGLILEGILAYSFKTPALVNQLSIHLASVPLYPASLTSILVGFGFNPSIDLFIPPVYILALSFYTISISFIIATLVLTNIMKVAEIGKACGTAMMSRTFVALPAVGVIGGAACCLSLPVLLSLAAPTTALISSSPIIFYVVYLLFPLATAVGLKYNMDSTNRIASKMSKIVLQKKVIADSTKPSQNVI